MPKIDIVRQSDGSLVFDPPVLFGAAVGDRVIWRNLDEREQHWITGEGKPKDAWFRFPLAPFVLGQTPDTTNRGVVLHTNVDVVYESFGKGIKGRISFLSSIA